MSKSGTSDHASRSDASEREARILGMSRDNALICLGYVLWGAASGFFTYIMPLYIESLGARPSQVGLTISIGSTGSVVSILAGGMLADRFSRRKQIVIAWSLAAAGIGIYAVARSWQVVAAGLVLVSMTNFVVSAISSYVTSSAKGQDAAIVFANIFAAVAIGNLITPAIGGAIIAASGFRPLFAVAFVFAVWSVLTMSLIREQPTPRASAEQSRAKSFAAQAIAPVRSYAVPLRNPRFRTMLITLTGLYLGTSTGLALLPNYLHDRIGLSPSTVGTLGSGAAIVTIVGSLALGRAARRLGTYRTLAVAHSILVTGFALVLAAPRIRDATALLGGLGFACRGGMQVQASISRAAVTGILEDGTAGPGYALQSTLLSLCQVLGPSIAGLLYTREPSLPLQVAFFAGLLFVFRLVIVGELSHSEKAVAR